MRALVTHNFGLKVISFLIAVAIWYRYSLVSPQGVTQTFERRLKVVNRDPKLSVSHAVEGDLVRITLSGRRLDLIQVDRQLEAQVDMKLVRNPLGEVQLPVEASFDPGLGLKVLAVEPKLVKINVKSAEPVAPLIPTPESPTPPPALD